MTGRFQPVHDQHLELIGIALTECEHVIVAVTNPDSGARREEVAHRHTRAANPFTYYERSRPLTAALAGTGWAGRTTVVLPRRAVGQPGADEHAAELPDRPGRDGRRGG